MPLTVPLIRMSPGCEQVRAAYGLVKNVLEASIRRREFCSKLAILNAKA